MFAKIQGLLAKVGTLLQPVLLLLVRLYWGWQFFIDGKGKLQNLDRVAAYFATLNLPMPRANAIAVSLTQCVFGLLLLGGLFTRFAALVLAGVMVVAYLDGAEKGGPPRDLLRLRQVRLGDPLPLPFRLGDRVLFRPGHLLPGRPGLPGKKDVEPGSGGAGAGAGIVTGAGLNRSS